jgi:hypothetical protein
MTTADSLLAHLYGTSVHEDEISADIDRFLEAGSQLTENESVAMLRDFFSRLMHAESEKNTDWDGLALAFENSLGVLREEFL